jgi:hypothetical protein
MSLKPIYLLTVALSAGHRRFFALFFGRHVALLAIFVECQFR